MTRSDTRAEQVLWPLGFGLLVLVLWEVGVRLFGVSPAILPPPSAILAAILSSGPTLWEDWVQTVVKGALNGLWRGTLAALIVAVIIVIARCAVAVFIVAVIVIVVIRVC